MSIRLEMLQAARLAPKTLGASTALVRDFLLAQQHADGGFRNRSGVSDLYYTVFGLDGLIALQAEVPAPAAAAYLRRFGEGEGLDFVHLCCLARCWAAVGKAERPPHRQGVLERIERFRTADGGYNQTPSAESGTPYGCFLALAAYQDLGCPMPEPLRLATCLASLQRADGAWSNARFSPAPGPCPPPTAGATLATAAAATVLRHLGQAAPPATGVWLLARSHPRGGFLAAPGAPMPDLLSTAVALHTLAGLQVSLETVKETCLDFVDTLWTNAGAFHGHWADDHLDCEYTFYGLLALGHLSW